MCTLRVARADGSTKRKVALRDVQDFAWSPNGKKLVYSWSTNGAPVEILQVPLDTRRSSKGGRRYSEKGAMI